jgi:hypothetical protein
LIDDEFVSEKKNQVLIMKNDDQREGTMEPIQINLPEESASGDLDDPS